MRARGFTLVELIIAAAICTVTCGTVLALAMTGERMYVGSANSVKSSARAHGLMERIVSEIRLASIHAEDVDEDDDPDDLDVEDKNGNGQIDDDWSLADGDTAQFLTANPSLGNGWYGPPVTFRFDGSRVWRDQNGESAVLATDVTALTFTRRGKRVVIHLVVKAGALAQSSTDYDRGGRMVSLVREVLVRN